MATQQEINNVITALRKIGAETRNGIKADVSEGGKMLVAAIKQRAPVGTRTHIRYNSAGKVVATYKPGNLKKSIRILPLRRVKNAVIVGPISRGKTPDGYYAHMLEFGTVKMFAQPFVEPAVNAVSGAVQDRILKALKNRIESHAKQLL